MENTEIRGMASIVETAHRSGPAANRSKLFTSSIKKPYPSNQGESYVY